MSARPICAQCGRKYGRRDVKSIKVTWTAGEEMPPYRGGDVLVGVIPLINMPRQQVEEVDYRHPSGRKLRWIGDDEASGFYETWDGRSWRAPYEPFCTLRCALAYARTAYERVRDRLSIGRSIR